ncbi:serine/threonine protein kinase [Streptomyces laurentii]|uniref:Serine/threonine protein kinase n=1 Tax=Streptomyces laurentii TaxID=39478 RepID=A0A169NV97_STRLU|nr:serine/threonine protein kinase [Streptomyces laurentii]
MLADRYRLPLPPPDPDGHTDPYAYAFDLVETRAFDTYSGQEVRVRQVPLPEVVDAEVVEQAESGDSESGADGGPYAGSGARRASRRPADPAVRRAVEAAQAAARIPDHPRLEQVFDVFAEAGSLWIVSEFVAATPLAELLAMGPLSPYRAAEIGADLLTALRALHAFGWTHRNVTSRTVLVCEDGRVVLTGLAAGAAEEALCGYASVPPPDEFPYAGPPEDVVYVEGDGDDAYALPDEVDPYAERDERTEQVEQVEQVGRDEHTAYAEHVEPTAYDNAYDTQDTYGVYAEHVEDGEPATAGPYALEPYEPEDFGPDRPQEPHTPTDEPGEPEAPGAASGTGYGPHGGTPYGAGRAGARQELPPARVVPPTGVPATAEVRAARAGAIAAYRAGARAAVRIGETGSLPVQRPGTPAPPSPPPSMPSAPGPSGPQWWSQMDEDDGDHDGDDDAGGLGGDRTPPPPPRAYLIGNWSDGPHASRDGGRAVPAGGGPGPLPPALPAGYTAAAPQPRPAPDIESLPAADAYRGPVTRLAAERARQTRMAVVGPVTERWAPEQAGPVHEHWRLAPPIGPATDLWALGALLYRAVQGHAPYPEDNAADLVQLVCAEPPAFAEECGPLRPVVESLLRQDPTERPDVEELSGWLRSLVRSAPEPDAATGAVPRGPADAARLPLVRKRGELVRRRRWWSGRGGDTKNAKSAKSAKNGRHRHAKNDVPDETALLDADFRQADVHETDVHESAGYVSAPADAARFERDGYDTAVHEPVGYPDAYREPVREPSPEPYSDAYADPYADPAPVGSLDDLLHDDRAYDRPPHDAPPSYGAAYDAMPEESYEEIPQRAPRTPRPPRTPGRTEGSPRSLGRVLLVLLVLLLGGAVAYAVLFMPKAGDPGRGDQAARGSAPASAPPAKNPAPPSSAPASKPPATTPPAPGTSDPALASGYVLRKDPEGFQVGVPSGWRRSPINDAGQVRFTDGAFTMIVVPGRDTVSANGDDPLRYQRDTERELTRWRESSWSDQYGLRRVDIGQKVMAEGTFSWIDSTGHEVVGRNLALIEGGRYHVVQVIGPSNERDRIAAVHDQAVKSYRVTR